MDIQSGKLQMINKKEKIIKETNNKLNKIIDTSIKKEKYDIALAAISASANIKYAWNQEYTDNFLENNLEQLSMKFNKVSGMNYQWVLFYDGFGLDTRGLALIYLKALSELGYSILYITVKNACNNQPEIDKVLSESKEFQKIYIKQNISFQTIQDVLNTVNKYQPKNAFLYTTPFDVVGIIAFERFSEIIRYQINLTDHAFWLGVNAFDYCIEFREYGACISADYRHINKNKIVLLPYYPYINYEQSYLGLPFEKKNKKIIFSGGALYKTLDESSTYYKIIEEILSKRENTIFLYAGSGNDSDLIKLQSKFPNRVIHIRERKDIYQLLCNIDIYLNTYPIVGGLMMQYASIAGKPPLTLVKDDSSDGILLNQHNIGIEFNNREELINEVMKLLDDDEYKKKRNSEIKQCVISNNEFTNALKSLLTKHNTQFNINYKIIDVSGFVKEYEANFTLENIEKSIINKSTIILAKEFPIIFLKRLLVFLKKKMEGICK